MEDILKLISMDKDKKKILLDYFLFILIKDKLELLLSLFLIYYL
jgi:hypothetical protein